MMAFLSVRPVVSGLLGRAAAPCRRFHASPVAQEKLFDKILIANRGEIACRVMATARKLGIKTVAVYSEPDVYAKHVRMADEAYLVGPAPTNQSYLKVENILDAVKRSGAQAVHPGYGFLSENCHFAAALESMGVQFMGPPSSAIESMGDKIESKKIAKDAGVHYIPGYLGEVSEMKDVIRIAKEIGFPVMVKASGGGGGKGMRVCWNEAELEANFRLSLQESISFFGNDRMLIEKYVNDGHHIEIQLLADKHGNVVYFPERECSIQRRNQKVIEEAPSPLLTPAKRKEMGLQAAALARKVGYVSAGTVEFLVDATGEHHYFLEMNTRLQVEHPITELITRTPAEPHGVDIVEHMIRIAAGQPLRLKQEDLNIKGWAVESRVYAENPLRGFLPSIGKLTTYVEPTTAECAAEVGDPNGLVRVDSGMLEGSEISTFYDPLIAKLITYGTDRKHAVRMMASALDHYVINSPTVDHNVCFLRDMMENKRFVAGKLSTKFIPDEYPNGFTGHVLNDTERANLLASAAVLRLESEIRNREINQQILNSVARTHHAENYVVSIQNGVSANGKKLYTPYKVHVEQKSPDNYVLNVEGMAKPMVLRTQTKPGETVFNAENESGKFALQLLHNESNTMVIQQIGTKYGVVVRTPREEELSRFMPEPKPKSIGNALVSPMPGTVFSVAVKPGDKVVTGQEICVVEAMKMQNMLHSEGDFVIKSVKIKAGQTVAVDEVLIEFEPRPIPK